MSGAVQKPYGFVANLRALQAAGFDRALQNMTFRVFALIVTYADMDGQCFPSIAKMAKKLGITRQAVQKQVRQLAQKGYLRITRQARRSNIYQIIRQPAGCSAPQPHKVDTTATQYGCPKTPLKKTGKDTSGHSGKEKIWDRQRYYYQEKKREEATGISKADEAALQAIMDKAHQGLSLQQRMVLDRDLREEAKRLYALPKQRHEFLQARYSASYRDRIATGQGEEVLNE